MPLRAVAADQLPFLPAAPVEPAPEVDLSVYGLKAHVKLHGKLHDTDFVSEVEDQWKEVEKTDSVHDSEQV